MHQPKLLVLTQHWVSEPDVSSVSGSQHDTKRLEKGDLRVRHGVGDLVQPSGRVNVVPCQSTIHGGNRVEVDGGAQVVLTTSAVSAGDLSIAEGGELDRSVDRVPQAISSTHLSTGDSGLNGDPVSNLDVLDTGTNGNDDTARFVAESGLVGDLPGAESSMLPEVHVRTAHTGRR